MKRACRAGFSAIDLLVVLAIIGILIGLLLPAVQKVRQAANRTRSQNNLKQLALAAHNYHDANGTFPPGLTKNNFSTVALLLPYIEQDNLYKNLDFDKPITDKANAPGRKVQIKIFLSPLDPLERVTDDYGATNYLFNAGSKAALADNDGVFFQDSKVAIKDILDGTSNTLMTGETLKGDGAKQATDVRRQHVVLREKELKNLKDDSGVQEFKDGKQIAADRCARWIDGGFLQGTFTGTRSANDSKPDVNCDGAGGLSGLRSFHSFVLIGLCDGSVRVVQDTIELKVWKLLSSRADGQPLPDF